MPFAPDPKDAEGLVEYLNNSWTAYHAVAETTKHLRAAGYVALSERQPWTIKKGGKYYFVRHGSTVVAFAVGAKYAPGGGFVIVGAHTDSPCLKLKPITKSGPKAGFQTIGVEPYGGGLWYTWFDRDLSIAGRVVVKRGDKFTHELVKIDRPILRIPSLAIHLNREVNSKGFEINTQNHLPPVLASVLKLELNKPAAASAAAAVAAAAAAAAEGGGKKPAAAGFAQAMEERHPPRLLQLVAEELRCSPADIVDFDLQLCDTQPAALGGSEREFVFSGRLDNLASCYSSLRALLAASSEESLAEETAVRMVAHFDHEEVGSDSAHGAGSPCMIDAIRRVASALAEGEEGALERVVRSSYLVSADMAHSVHPNYADKHEANHQPKMHEGVVVKRNSNQRYASDAVTAFLFRELGRRVEVPIQEFVVRSDLACGSTIGPIVSAHTGIRTVDVGAPMLSMHSVREMCGADDVSYAVAHFAAVLRGFSALDRQLEAVEAGI